jgi:glycosyltransferase involved in cell wall biosynthesis
VRVLIINKYYPPDSTNTAQLLAELVEDLASEFTVDLVVGRPSYDPAETAPNSTPNVRVRRVPSSAFGRSSIATRLVDYVSFLFLGLGAACLARRPNVVVTMSDPPLLEVLGALVAVRHRCAFVQICHDLHPDITLALGKVSDGVATRLWRRVNRNVLRRADRIVVVGRDMAEKLTGEGVPRERICFIPTWASAQENSSQASGETRSERGWLGKFVVMHSGNMGLSQNLGIYPEVASLLRDMHDLVIVLLGGGPAKEKLVEEVAARGLRNIEFVPRLAKPEAQRLMSAADIHVVSLVPGLWGCAAPSKTYGIMAAGRPFLASVDAGSEPARIVQEFDCGCVVPAGSAPELARAIRSARSLPLADMGRRAERAFKARYERATATSANAAVLRDAVDVYGRKANQT